MTAKVFAKPDALSVEGVKENAGCMIATSGLGE
jgi:hypothetical protein